MKGKILYVIIMSAALFLFPQCNGSGSGGTVAVSRTIGVVNNGIPVSLAGISKSYYGKAQQEIKLIYSGTSHSSQINSGIEELSGREPWCSWNFLEGTYGLPGDLGAPDFTAWESETRSYLDSNSDVNACMWSWCGQVGDADVEGPGRYLDLMEGLIRDYPGVTFIFMTGHCDGQGRTGGVHRENEKIRDHCFKNNRWLFDFADFDATNPAGVNFLDKNVTDNGSYDGGNWTEEWYQEHPEDWHACTCAHSESARQSLNCNRKAIGFVHMMARIAGWDGISLK